MSNSGNVSFSSFKPNKDSKGSCLMINYDNDAQVYFMEMRPQKSGTERSFDKDKRLVVALGLPDIGEILAVIKGRKGGLGTLKGEKWSGIYHETDKNSSSISMEFNDKYGTFYVSLGRKVGSDVTRLGIPLTLGECVILENYLESNIVSMLEFRGRGNNQPAQTSASAPAESAQTPF